LAAFDAATSNDTGIPMRSYIIRYGIVAGLIVATPMVWRMLTAEPNETEMPVAGMLLGYLTMIVSLTAVFLGVKSYRDKVLGGAIRFLPAFGLGVAISAVACLFYVIGWEISLAYSPFDFISFYKMSMIESATAKGVTVEDLKQVTADAESFAKMYRNPWIRMPITFIEMFPVGVLVSLITAAVLKRPGSGTVS
jgi:hypothetical protein